MKEINKNIFTFIDIFDVHDYGLRRAMKVVFKKT